MGQGLSYTSKWWYLCLWTHFFLCHRQKRIFRFSDTTRVFWSDLASQYFGPRDTCFLLYFWSQEIFIHSKKRSRALRIDSETIAEGNKYSLELFQFTIVSWEWFLILIYCLLFAGLITRCTGAYRDLHVWDFRPCGLIVAGQVRAALDADLHQQWVTAHESPGLFTLAWWSIFGRASLFTGSAGAMYFFWVS